ncbi:MAG: glycosyltransferase [Acidobacteria bacterium]|nr:MAG: glycosyltransferase [Acidobacteriota bacterium]
MRKKKAHLRQVAVIGDYLPRQCGIATFTTDLCEALAAEYREVNCFALAVTDTEEGYAYPERVRFELMENDLSSYRRAADFLNINGVDVVCVQHEYGIYGGPAGSHILALLGDLRMPVVTTLHTILRQPNPHQRKVLEELATLSDRLIVMSRRGAAFLQEVYAIPAEKIDVIPHGIPDVPFVDPNFYKDLFGVEGRLVLLTFGLLSPNKGIEDVIEALPAILDRYPNVVYIVLGATHPHVKRAEGETYRLSLQRLARARGVERNVVFHNRFVSLDELIEFIGAADIYITPYLNREQIVSGTLSYAVGAGKAVISTPYWYAEELLAEGRGILVPFRDPAAIAEKVIYLLDNEAERHAIRKRAYLYGREMVWSKVARQYMESFERARQERVSSPRPLFFIRTVDKWPGELPLLKLDHLRRLTDDTGMLQHANFTVPNYHEGYATDDNARALIVAVLLEQIGVEPATEVENLAVRYLSFLWYAYNPEAGRFRNFLSYDRQWLEDVGSEDSHGRSLWGLGTMAGRTQNPRLRHFAGRLFQEALPAAVNLNYPRSWAFSLIGIHEYLKQFSGDRAAQNALEELAERLLGLYRTHRSPDWPWFEDVLTYCNAKLSHALLACGHRMSRGDMLEAGLRSLQWLASIQRADDGHFVPIGCHGFYRRGGPRARFDQQPIEAQAMVSACLEAHRITDDERWLKEAQRAFEWFLGRNDLGLPLYDPGTGGCRDGLQPDRINQNQGAESTVAFLLSLLEMQLAEHVLDPARGEILYELPQRSS